MLGLGLGVRDVIVRVSGSSLGSLGSKQGPYTDTLPLVCECEESSIVLVLCLRVCMIRWSSNWLSCEYSEQCAGDEEHVMWKHLGPSTHIHASICSACLNMEARR